MQPYWDALKNLINSHTLSAGIILGIIVGFIPSVLAGHFGNIYTEKRKKRTLEGKQNRFVDELTSVTRDYVTSPPTDETEVTQRRERVAQNVKTLSLKIFNQDTPIAESIRPDNTEYPKLPCKWCHREHQSFNGSKGACRNCGLPLDFWMGIQGQPK